MYHYNDLTNQKFGRLTALNKIGRTSDRHVLWSCRCDCGKVVSVASRDLITGHTQSCGCLKTDVHTKHGGRGMYKTERLYFVWRGIKSRCEIKSATGYEYYGARGIRLCQEWHDYGMFKEWAYSHGYDDKAPQWECTIDRIDPNGNYEPNNCRWVDMSVQNKNKRNSKIA